MNETGESAYKAVHHGSQRNQADHNDEITFSFESYGRRGKGPSDETSARLGAAIKGRVYSSVRVLKAAG